MSATPHAISPLPTSSDIMQLMNLAGGYRISQAILVVAQLGIADILAAGPKPSDQLAHETGTHGPTLFRLLRFLSGAGLFTELPSRNFALTSLGAGLRKDVQGSFLPSVLWLLGEHQQRSWPHLMHTVKTGETAFLATYGLGPFDQMRTDAANSALFNAAMTGSSARSVKELVERYD